MAARTKASSSTTKTVGPANDIIDAPFLRPWSGQRWHWLTDRKSSSCLCRANGKLACPVESSIGVDPLNDNVHDPPAAIGEPLLQAHCATKVRKVEGKAAGAG